MAIKCDVEGLSVCDNGICSYSVRYIETNNESLDGLALVTFGFLHSLSDNWTPIRPAQVVTWTETRDC